MYAGIDFDSHAIHVVLLPEDGMPEYHFYELEGRDAFERARTVRDAMPSRGWWSDQGVIAAMIEEPMRRRGGGQQLMVVQGAVLACLPRDLLVDMLMPSQWRTKNGMKGNATKEEVSLYAHRILTDKATALGLLRITLWGQDACDALCLALAAEKMTVLA